MKNRRALFRSVFAVALVLMSVFLYKMSNSSKSSALIVKNSNQATYQNSSSTFTYNGQNMYTAKATFYDYYSDSQVGADATPLKITDGTADTKNTFSKFNKRLYDVMNYGNTSLSPAKYPMYQGSFPWGGPTDLTWLFKTGDENHNASTNFWIGANCDQEDAAATLGLVDSKLVKDSYGIDTLSQTNTNNGKSSLLPFFDKKFLTTTKFEGSNLSLGTVIENVKFPFRQMVNGNETYYEFYSRQDAVRFNASNQLEYKGYNQSENQVANKSGRIGFYPYNSPAESGKESLNYGHGLKIEIPFAMTQDGKLNGKDMVFEFSGDDDVWVFVDGYLALDLGGSHQPIGGQINFAQGKATIEKIKNTSSAFSSHSIEKGVTKITNYEMAFSNELKEKLKNTDETHTLTFFYMERGMGGSNFNVKFNLPEPSSLKVENKVDVENVGETFKEETKQVAAKDVFVYDITDKTKNKKATVDMINGDNVLLLNEFSINDNILLQETGLKDSTRKLTQLYSTSWNLKDTNAEISKGDGVIVKDSRTNNDTFLFKNLNDNVGPELTSVFVNRPIIGTFKLKCDVSEQYKKNNSNYKDKTYKYIVSYKNVFGGGSQEKLYSGKYKLIANDGTSIEKQTNNGIIELKPGEQINITAIPILTEMFIKVELDEGDNVEEIKTTDQFVKDSGKGTSSGKININDNAVEYTITNTTNNVKNDEDKDTNTTNNVKNDEDKDTNTKNGDTIVVDETAPKMEEQPEEDDDKEVYDEAIQTGDETNMVTIAIVMGISLVAMVLMIIFIRSKNRRRFV